MSLSKKTVRREFRYAVFKRDGYMCLFCSIKIDLDAHHIVNRNFMPGGGYILSNGATLCETHHLDAEKGVLSVEQIRAAITKRIS